MYNGTVYDSLPKACTAAGVSSSEIYRRVSKLGISLQEAFDSRLADDIVYKSWTAEEDEILKIKYPKMGKQVMQSLPGRSWASIFGRVSRLGLTYDNPKKPWSDAEVRILLDNYANMDVSELCGLLPGRSVYSIRHYAKRLKLTKTCAQNLTISNKDIRMAADYDDGWFVIVCDVCSQTYILQADKVSSFTHSDCSKLTAVPAGWCLPRSIIERM